MYLIPSYTGSAICSRSCVNMTTFPAYELINIIIFNYFYHKKKCFHFKNFHLGKS